ncbi:hypothetical protein BH10BAC5_BH10BAC5_28920 [soil metagenome]
MRIFLVIIICSVSVICFGQDKIELKNADSLTGKVTNGEEIREAFGNVSFVQGNIRVLCNIATQYIAQNKVELRGNVRIYQDSLTILTSKATYYGNEKKAIGEGGVTLKDPNATLRANNGIYYFNDAKAFFSGDVIIINPDYRITSKELTYMRNSEDSYAKGNVIVTTDSAIIKAQNIDFYKRQFKTFAYTDVSIYSDSTYIYSDTLTNYSNEKRSVAAGHVKVESMNNNTLLYGDQLVNLETQKYTKLSGNAMLIQVDKDQTSSNKDTLYIYSSTMEAFKLEPEYYVADGNVETIRGKFFSKCNRTVYFKETSKVALSGDPVVWQDEFQITGDSISADLPQNKLQNIYVRKLAELADSKISFMISGNPETFFPDRFNQMSGKNISMYFTDNKADSIISSENSNSLYFIFEERKGNGMNISEGENIKILFDENKKASKIIVQEDVKGQFIPEQLTSSQSKTLPGYILRSDKPVKRILPVK